MIKLEINEETARCLQRMIVTEIDNQKMWKSEDKELGIDSSFRDSIIKEMQDLQEQLVKQGIAKFIKCY